MDGGYLAHPAPLRPDTDDEEHANGASRLLLTALSTKGKDGASELQRQSFGYNSDAVPPPNPAPAANTTVLTRTLSSNTGAVNYFYAWHKISCANSTCPDLDGSMAGNLRRGAVATVQEDGGGNRVYTGYYYGLTQPPSNTEWGAVADDGGFLGFKEVQVTHYALNNPDAASALRWEKLLAVENSAGADASRQNPDGRRGKLARREVWSKNPAEGGVLLSSSDYDWRAYWLEETQPGVFGYGATPQVLSWEVRDGAAFYPATVIQQRAVTETLYTPGQPSIYNSTVYTHETEYGNLLQVSEWADGNLQRRTAREYYPVVATIAVSGTNEVNLYIADRLARQRVYDGGGICQNETRHAYDRYESPGNDYRLPPTQGLLSERDAALASCSDAAVILTTDPLWQVERFAYDAYGNQTVQHQMAAADGSLDRWTNTTYDTFYHLFPVRRSAALSAQVTLSETASYYGVNATSSGEDKLLSDPWAFWGAMAEWCDVNGLCVRQAYDQHSRRTLRWEGVAAGALWSNNLESGATVRWDYRSPLSHLDAAGNPIWNDVTVSEWRASRCAGNFVRRHYNGFGQLTQEQGPDDGWSYAIDGCGVTQPSPPEVDVDYAYDGLGRQIAVSVPHAVTANWVNRPAYWGSGYTLTSYDALSRVTQTTAPNGEQTITSYSGRQTKVTGIGRGGDPNKILSWTETDGLGNLAVVRTGSVSGSEVTSVTLRHDAVGNLRQMTPVLGQTTVITYDLDGRKTQMQDPDLGLWSYQYNRQGELKQQTDACGNVTSMSYDSLGRLASKGLSLGTLCPASSLATSYTGVTYQYDAGHSGDNRSLGQLTGVSYNDGSYTRTLRYNGRGQVASETLRLSGAPSAYTSTYGYDAYDRPLSTVYPDGEVVQVTGYNSRGMAAGLASTLGGTTATLVDCVQHDAAGRLVRLRYAGSGPCAGGAGSTGVHLVHYYWPWLGSSNDSNGRPRGMAVGTTPESINVASVSYNYDSFGNVLAHSLGSVDATLVQTGTFTYDEQNRVTSGYGQTFSWKNNGDIELFAGLGYTYDPIHPHAVNTVGGVDRFDYNLNGSMSVRNKNTAISQTLRWDSRNQLAQVTWGSPVRNEYYGYDEGGRRVARAAVQNGVTTVTFYPFAHYEQTGSSGAGVIKYYFFGGERVAMRTGSGAGTLRLLFKDRLSSTVHVTDGAGNQVAGRGYYAFGATMRSTGTMPTDHLFTDQQQDATGLYYYGARYYDPTIGHFISPDTLVPDPTNVMDYQRYGYARGNPLKYNDPTGHQAVCPGICGSPDYFSTLADVARQAGPLAPYVLGGGLVAGFLIVGATETTWELPRYPAPETIPGEFNLGETFPPPGSNTVSSLLPGPSLGLDMDTVVPAEVVFDPSEISVLADPLSGPVIGENVYNATQPQGGTYTLIHPTTGEVMRVGRTNNLERREAEHKRAYPDFTFRVDVRTDDYAAQRGREQIIYDLYGQPPLNKVRPVAPKNPHLLEYLRAGASILPR